MLDNYLRGFSILSGIRRNAKLFENYFSVYYFLVYFCIKLNLDSFSLF